MSAETPRQFFNVSLKPAVEEWRRDKLSHQKAVHALTQVDAMTEWMFRYLQRNDPARLAAIPEPTAYRKDLRARHLALGLAWDARGINEGGEQISVVDEDGQEHALDLLLEQAVTAWEMELSSAGL